MILRAALAMALIGTAAQSNSFGHKDWTVVCDNIGTCHAAGYQADVHDPVSVLFTRKAGPDAQIKGQLQIYHEGDWPKVIDLLFDGTVVATIPVIWNDASGFDLSPDTVAALVDAVAGTTDVTFETAVFSRRLSGAGASAALLFMDDIQGRLGDLDAAIRRGTNAVSNAAAPKDRPIVQPVVPDPKALQNLDALKPAVGAAILKWSRENDDCWSAQTFEDLDLSLHAYNSTQVAASAFCWRGAYNAGRLIAVADVQTPSDIKVITNSAVDLEDGLIFEAHKSRGLGDCWTGRQWVWTGTDFALTKDWTSGLCRGFPGGAWILDRHVVTLLDPMP